MEHKLKTWPGFFRAIVSGEKTFEIRKNDRDFKAGDTLLLKEFQPESSGGHYTGAEVKVKVQYILGEEAEGFGVMPGFCVMAIKLEGKAFEYPNRFRQPPMQTTAQSKVFRVDELGNREDFTGGIKEAVNVAVEDVHPWTLEAQATRIIAGYEPRGSWKDGCRAVPTYDQDTVLEMLCFALGKKEFKPGAEFAKEDNLPGLDPAPIIEKKPFCDFCRLNLAGRSKYNGKAICEDCEKELGENKHLSIEAFFSVKRGFKGFNIAYAELLHKMTEEHQAEVSKLHKVINRLGHDRARLKVGLKDAEKQINQISRQKWNADTENTRLENLVERFRASNAELFKGKEGLELENKLLKQRVINVLAEKDSLEAAWNNLNSNFQSQGQRLEIVQKENSALKELQTFRLKAELDSLKKKLGVIAGHCRDILKGQDPTGETPASKDFREANCSGPLPHENEEGRV